MRCLSLSGRALNREIGWLTTYNESALRCGGTRSHGAADSFGNTRSDAVSDTNACGGTHWRGDTCCCGYTHAG
jgi:hypothetical protein